MVAAVASTDERTRLFRRLARRNRVVGVLRWLLPVVGAVVLAVVIGTMVLSALGQRFGFANIRIDRDNLVVDTPELTSTTEDGSIYALSALTARVSPTQSDLVDMVEPKFSVTQPTASVMTATALDARLQTSSQLLDVPGTTTVASTDGLAGTLDAMFIDLMNWTMVAGGKVDLTLPDGTRIQADGMTYDRDKKLYTFSRVTLDLPMTPGAAEETAE